MNFLILTITQDLANNQTIITNDAHDFKVVMTDIINLNENDFIFG